MKYYKIFIRFSDSTEEINIPGAPEDFRQIQMGILSILESEYSECWKINTTLIAPYSYERCLTSLSICRSQNLLKISVSENSLNVSGNDKSLEVLQDWFDFEYDTKEGYHHHLEFTGDDFWIEPNSMAMVISLHRDRLSRYSN